MQFRYPPELDAFRQEVRTFIQDNWTGESIFNIGEPSDLGPTKDYEAKLVERGWLTMAWPKEYGGLGLSKMHQMVYHEEHARAGAPSGGGQGISMLGPVLMLVGTDEQKQRFLPDIANARVVWCQGFSEPGAGSDLASLQTRAVRDGDEYVINGQKIWTTDAHRSDWCHLLARTDPDAPKHKGISYFMVDMKSPGIEVRPLINMLGEHVINETFFTDVRVPANQMVGDENRGWYAAATLLDFERSGINYSTTAIRLLTELVRWAKQAPRGAGVVWDDLNVRSAIADLLIESEVGKLLGYRVTSMQAKGLVPNVEASEAKILGTELAKKVASLGIAVMGLDSTRVEHDPDDPWIDLKLALIRMHVWGSVFTVFGGTNEIQKNIMATRGLGLPRG